MKTLAYLLEAGAAGSAVIAAFLVHPALGWTITAVVLAGASIAIDGDAAAAVSGWLGRRRLARRRKARP